MLDHLLGQHLARIGDVILQDPVQQVAVAPQREADREGELIPLASAARPLSSTLQNQKDMRARICRYFKLCPYQQVVSRSWWKLSGAGSEVAWWDGSGGALTSA